MDVEKTIKVKSSDGVVVELSSKAAARSGLLRGIIEDYPEDSEFPINNVTGSVLEKVKEYLVHYENEEPPIISKPLKSNKFEECATEWDKNFVGNNNDTALSLILAANFMDIKPLLELISANIACKLRGTTTESIRKDFGINELNQAEKAQIEKDKLYLEENL